MPREKRKTAPSLPHLVVARAASGVSLFYSDEDYLAYLSFLRQLVRDRMVTIYAFCLQQEEIRLVLKPGRLPLSKIMQRLHGSHTLRINARMQRHGSLFRGRFESKSFLETDLRNAVRGVHLWPVRSGLVRHAEGFRYSSHSVYLGQRDYQHDFVQASTILESFSSSLSFAQKSFAKFVESAALESDSDGFSQVVIDVANVKEGPKWLYKRGFMQSLAKRISLVLSINLANLRGPSRRQDLVMARRLMATVAVLAAGRTVTEVAKFLGRDKAQVSRLVSQGMDLLEGDEAFRVLYDSIWQEKKKATTT